jgi:AraC family ethanolamine operon transcriptional activator
MMKYTAGRISGLRMRDEIKWELTRILLLALAKSKSIKPKRRNFSKRREIADRVLEYVNVELPTPKSISELCHVAEVDDRTLRNIFYEQFFLSPKKFLNFYRLNAVRTELIRLDPTQIYVTDIANKYGFWHMGQFAKDYRRLFGELPSETLRREDGRSQ